MRTTFRRHPIFFDKTELAQLLVTLHDAKSRVGHAPFLDSVIEQAERKLAPELLTDEQRAADERHNQERAEIVVKGLAQCGIAVDALEKMTHAEVAKTLVDHVWSYIGALDPRGEVVSEAIDRLDRLEEFGKQETALMEKFEQFRRGRRGEGAR